MAGQWAGKAEGLALLISPRGEMSPKATEGGRLAWSANLHRSQEGRIQSNRPLLACRPFVARKAKQLAFRPLRGPLLNPSRGRLAASVVSPIAIGQFIVMPSIGAMASIGGKVGRACGKTSTAAP